MANMIEMGKTYTSYGQPVELITVDGRLPWPVIGYVGDKSLPEAFTCSGRSQRSPSSSDSDLVELKPVHVVQDSEGDGLEGAE